MIDTLIGLVAPHICESCGAAGDVLCKRCFFDILSTKWTKCVGCEIQLTTPIIAKNGNMCQGCRKKLPFCKVFVVGKRAGALKPLVGNYKYFSKRGGAKTIAKLLAKRISGKDISDLTVVPLPTIPKHVRQRGFDHMKWVAKKLARVLKCGYRPLLVRTDNTSQHGVGKTERQRQAASTFRLNDLRHIPQKVLLIDDIYTTGATVKAAAKLLKSAGVKEVWLGIIARN